MSGKLNGHISVPRGALSVLPGFGATTGKDLISHPLVKKVDITVSTAANSEVSTCYTYSLGWHNDGSHDRQHCRCQPRVVHRGARW
jgi:hypothetical protein